MARKKDARAGGNRKTGEEQMSNYPNDTSHPRPPQEDDLPLFRQRRPSEAERHEAGRVEGQRRRDKALDRHARHRARLIERAQCALLRAMLARDDGTGSIDDAREAIDIPPGVDPTCMGAVDRPLRRAGIVEALGYVQSRRRIAHRRPVLLLRLIDRAGALRHIHEAERRQTANDWDTDEAAP